MNALSTKQKVILTLSVMVIAQVILFATAPKPAQVMHENFVPGNLPLQLWGGVMGGAGLASSPLWVQYFLKFLLVMGLTGLFFMPKHVEARWAAGGVLMGMFDTFFVVPYLPIVSLGGMYAVLHFLLWTPGLYLLLKHRPFMAGLNPFAIWSGILTLMILFSFIFDVRDSLVYIPYVWNLNFG